MSVHYGINLIASDGMLNLPRLAIPSIGTPPVVSLASGNNDLYTVPAGKRVLALFSTCYNTSGGALNVYHTIKVSGTTYRAGSSVSINGSVAGNPQAGLCYEAGEIVGLNADGVGMNAALTLYEFDAASSPLKGARILDTVNGDTTLYTCPANKRAHLLLNTAQYGAGHLSYVGTSGTPIITPYLVPSGGSKGATNQIGSATSVTALIRSQFLISCGLTPGDFIVINANGTGALVCANIQELPYP